MEIITRAELEELASKSGVPFGQLAEAQEVMLLNGVSHDEIRSKMVQLCEDAKIQNSWRVNGSIVEMFNRLLKGFIAHVEARNSPNG